jgi:glucan phosphorylase
VTCKAAGDEQLNFIAVGLPVRQGYFTQSVDGGSVQHPGYRDMIRATCRWNRYSMNRANGSGVQWPAREVGGCGSRRWGM